MPSIYQWGAGAILKYFDGVLDLARNSSHLYGFLNGPENQEYNKQLHAKLVEGGSYLHLDCADGISVSSFPSRSCNLIYYPCNSRSPMRIK
jgi:hypothetical protein